MKLVFSLFSTPKKGGLPRENEDHFFPHEAEIRRGRVSVAIADGASEGYMSKLWSKILTISYVNFDRTNLDIRRFTDFCVDIYDYQLEGYIQRRMERGSPLRWFEENLMNKGSFSTLLGVTYVQSSPAGGHWVSYSVGDCCLFQIRGELIDVFPVMDPSAFGNSPDLISSNPAYNVELESRVKVKTGRFLFGDTFYLMTDAIAHWFVTQIAEGTKPWNAIDEFLESDNQGLPEYIDRLRMENRLKNDDVTIARVSLLEE
jgi:hypothetical protein